jgi:hypothetical protein
VCDPIVCVMGLRSSYDVDRSTGRCFGRKIRMLL